LNTQLTWDAASRLTRIEEGVLADLQYTYNAADEVVEESRTDPLGRGTIKYEYDNASRLVAVDYGGENRLGYTYDSAGNLLRRAGKVPSETATERDDTFAYDDACQLSSPGYSYDKRGRLTTSPGHTYAWSGASRLVGVDDVALTYNGLGDLVTCTEGSTTTQFYYNYAIEMAPIMAEKNEASGQFTRYYVWTPDGSLLYLIDASDGNKVSFYHFDHRGSTMALTDSDGSVTDTYSYTSYGELLAHQGSSSQPFTYVGQYGVRWEPVGGLYHMRARYYDPATARFLTRDPVWPVVDDPESLNPYQYANRNPLQFVDETGEQARAGYLVDGLPVIPEDSRGPRETADKIANTGIFADSETERGRAPGGEQRGGLGTAMRVLQVGSGVRILRGGTPLVPRAGRELVRRTTGVVLKHTVPRVSLETGSRLVRGGLHIAEVTSKVAKAAGPVSVAVEGYLSAREVGGWAETAILEGPDAAIRETQETFTAKAVGWIGEREYVGAPVRLIGKGVSLLFGD
jgi:RHS repeat-associated protein